MGNGLKHSFSGIVASFLDQRLPEKARPVGYAALIEAFKLRVPAPPPLTLSAIGRKHRLLHKDGWNIYAPTYAPPDDLEGHLNFALRYEGIDLLVLKTLFKSIGPEPIEEIVRTTPTGTYARRVWFLYEWLLETELDLPAAKIGAYVFVVDPGRQWGAGETLSARHRVKNNLPGTPSFCPMIFRTEVLNAFVQRHLNQCASNTLDGVPANVLARANASFLRNDSKSSVALEAERAREDRVQRWGRLVGEAGKQPIDLDELLRLRGILIDDRRFADVGLRSGGGFVGGYDRVTNTPLPDHIGARPEDLTSLIEGLAAFDRNVARYLDPVIAAAVLAFGFAYIHPFEDGNGRMHRYLIHHVLAESGFNPPGLVLPISAIILNSIDDYRKTLQTTSSRMLRQIEWDFDDKGNVRVINDTADYYRFFDATPHAEFLYKCIEPFITVELPTQTAFFWSYEVFKRHVELFIDVPKGGIDALFRFLIENGGLLPNDCRTQEFARLTDNEVAQIEMIYEIAQSRTNPTTENG